MQVPALERQKRSRLLKALMSCVYTCPCGTPYAPWPCRNAHIDACFRPGSMLSRIFLCFPVARSRLNASPNHTTSARSLGRLAADHEVHGRKELLAAAGDEAVGGERQAVGRLLG